MLRLGVHRNLTDQKPSVLTGAGTVVGRCAGRLVSSQSIRQTADCLRVSKICALVIGKMMHAAELGILLTVSPDSRCLEKDLLLPVENYITIVGNLLENAIEELSAGSPEIREITLGIYCDPGCNIITCR